MTKRVGLVAPLPLLLVFGAFLFAIGYLVAASLTRRNAPVFPVTPVERTRAANWEAVGDTLTIDATDGGQWQYVSLARGRVLAMPDTNGWELAVQRYRVIAPPNGSIADLAAAPDDTPINHWYRYNLLTHLLEPNGHTYAVRTPSAAYELSIVSYYCPKLVAGCLTIRYAALAPRRR